MKLTVEKLVYGGKGIGRTDEKVCFVPYVLPEEEVEVKIIREKKGFLECEPVEIIRSSPYRVEPACRYFTYCGGCDYLHIKYEKQVELKNSIFVETLERIGKLKEIPLREPVPSTPDTRYRNRVQFKVHREKVGFYKKESRQVINIDSCLLLKEELNEAVYGIKEVLPFFSYSPVEVHLHHSSENQMTVKFLFRKAPKRIPLGLKHMKAFFGESLQGFGIYQMEEKFPKRMAFIGSPFVYESVGNYRFRVSADSFFQVNRFQTANLIQLIEKELQKEKIETAVDLYSGVGTFSIPMAKYANRVFGIEINPYAVQDANHNRKINGMKNLFFQHAPAGKVLDFLVKKDPQLVLVDPPRSGLDRETINAVLSIKSLKKLIYISCNPATLARDLSVLTKNGFHISSTQLIDMFPHTYHIESLTFLEKLR